MRKIFSILLVLIAASSYNVPAQKNKTIISPTLDDRYEFTVITEVQATPVGDQSRSGTCWSFSGNSFLESELLRMGKGEYDLSEMWVVRNTYIDKAEKYVRMHGNVNFSAGGAFHDVLNVYRKYGMVPEEAYKGLNYGADNHNHGELDAVLQAYVKAVIANRKLSTAWMEGYIGILDAYLGPAPETFEYKGKQYTPKSFAEHLGLDMDDYVSLGSYTHHPFYTQFALEIPDNWAWGSLWNLPLDEFMATVDNALNTGYSVAWASDVSEKGFMYAKGFAIIPAEQEQTLEGTELSRWVKLSEDSKMLEILEKNGEMKVTQELRQQAFDNYETTDDHGMLITGIARDQRKDKFYKVKNSWGTNQKYEGYFYTSAPFVAYKTTNIIVHKDALTDSVRNKLGLK